MSLTADERLARIIEFVRGFYLSVQAQGAEVGFESAVPDLTSLLSSRGSELAQAADWVWRTTEPTRSGATSLDIDLATAPPLMHAVFAFLGNWAAIGNDVTTLARFAYVGQDQSMQNRVELMRDVVRSSFSRPIVALEIGTWFGRGSTRIWIETLPRGSILVLLDSWRSYLSASDKSNNDTAGHYRLMDHLPQSAMASTLREVLKAEASNSGIEIAMIRGRSGSMLELLKEDAFDFVYIDGSHYYADVKKDIALGKRLARRSFSVVCGDDLETVDMAPIEAARLHADRDYVMINGVGFHPGVALAVSEAFSRVNMGVGFWWAFQHDGAWGV
jgi:predicted O-methyltransferase YrrM